MQNPVLKQTESFVSSLRPLPNVLRAKVVIMDDSEPAQKKIRAVLENELNWDVLVAENKEEALALLEDGCSFFIFDNWVGKNKHEGLDALEQIRAVNNEVFVAIFSAYPHFKKMAFRLGCSTFEMKSSDLSHGVRRIAIEMLKHLGKTVEHFEGHSNTWNKPEHEKLDDENLIRYRELITDEVWFQENEGKYVVFVDGNFVKSSRDCSQKSKIELLDWLQNAEEYYSKKRFFTQVKKDVIVIDEPTSFWFNQYD